MGEFDEQSRIDKYDKRRKNTRNISIFLIIGVVLLIVLIALLTLGGNDNTDQQANAQDSNSVNTSPENKANGESDETASQNPETSDNTEEQTDEESDDMTIQDEDEGKDGDIESLETEDNLVIEAYTKHWEPVGTQQSGSHTIVYDDGSQDRREMEKAIQTATGLSKQDISYLWLANNGDQKVLATFSDSSQKSHYRVYMSWVNEEGWQPTKVEILKENDQMHRFK